MKRRKMPDTYEKWERSGLLERKLEGIRDMISRRATQKQVAEYLGITQKTLIKLKKKHPRLADAIDRGNEDLRKELNDAMYKMAVGYHYEVTTSTIEESKSGTRKRVVKETRYAKPEFPANRYLLITRFGIDYNEKKAEIELMEKRIENTEEVWSGENSLEGNNKTKGVRK